MRGLDHASIAQAFARPGQDPRQWVSLGTVDPETPDAPSTRFKDPDGNALQTGPLVGVTLQPSGIPVSCRVASFIAGNGEGSWLPFQQGDEVLVALPQGSEAASPVIIGRLNQSLDAWPGTVAGQDATKNNFGFWRLRSPFLIESAEAFVIRSAKTGSQVGIDSTGQVIINNGDRNNLFIGSDAINLGDGDQTIFLQLNFNEQRFTLGMVGSRLELSASGESQLFCTGSLNLGTSGARGKGHAVTVEQLLTWLNNMICGLALAGAFSGPFASGPWAVPGAAVGLLNALWASIIPAQSTPNPVALNGAPGGNTAQLQPSYQLLTVSMLNPLASLDVTGLIPGTGRAGLMY